MSEIEKIVRHVLENTKIDHIVTVVNAEELIAELVTALEEGLDD